MNPQSWNAYAYVVGNPLNAVDPSGMWNWGLGNCYYNTVAAYVDGQFQGYDTQFLGCFDFPNFGNGLRTGGGRSAGGARKAKPPKIDCSHAPPMPPTPREANVDANELAVRIAAQEQQAALLAAARAGQAGAADNGFSFWISKVPPYAAWDYKNQFGSQYTAFGNFNFGATCNIVGLALHVCQRGAGTAAYGSAALTLAEEGIANAGGYPTMYKWTAGPGNPAGSPANDNGMPVYGDQAGGIENQAVIAGYGYAAWQKACGVLP